MPDIQRDVAAERSVEAAAKRREIGVAPTVAFVQEVAKPKTKITMSGMARIVIEKFNAKGEVSERVFKYRTFESDYDEATDSFKLRDKK